MNTRSKSSLKSTPALRVSTRSCAIAFMAVLVLGGCQQSENPQTVLEAVNLEKALYCMEILENRPDLEPADRLEILDNECIAETYIQHSPHMDDGRDTLLSVFAKRYENFPDTSTSIKRTAAAGDLVWMHQHVKRTPEDPGRAVVNIFRMEGGKFAEHWNVVQDVPAESRNNNTMF